MGEWAKRRVGDALIDFNGSTDLAEVLGCMAQIVR